MSVLTNLVPLPYRIAAVVLLFVASAGAGFVKGITYEADRHTREQVVLQKKYDEQKIKTAQTIELQNRISNDAEQNYKKHIAAINNYYSGLLKQSSSSSTVRQVPQTPSKSDVASSNILFAEECTKTTQQLVDLQTWITQQYETGK